MYEETRRNVTTPIKAMLAYLSSVRIPPPQAHQRYTQPQQGEDATQHDEQAQTGSHEDNDFKNLFPHLRSPVSLSLASQLVFPLYFMSAAASRHLA